MGGEEKRERELFLLREEVDEGVLSHSLEKKRRSFPPGKQEKRFSFLKKTFPLLSSREKSWKKSLFAIPQKEEIFRFHRKRRKTGRGKESLNALREGRGGGGGLYLLTREGAFEKVPYHPPNKGGKRGGEA